MKDLMGFSMLALLIGSLKYHFFYLNSSDFELPRLNCLWKPGLIIHFLIQLHMKQYIVTVRYCHVTYAF